MHSSRVRERKENLQWAGFPTNKAGNHRIWQRSFRLPWQQADTGESFPNSSQTEMAQLADVEETLKRIEAHKGVIGTVVVNAEGIPIRTSLDNSSAVQYAGLLQDLTMRARSSVRDMDPQNDLTFLRIRSKKHEIMVSPENNFLLIVIQNPCE
ncbi:dynein light chain roadblock-type 2-like isoform X1 [Gouania willdenowi]|uniref:Roadblock/LAMTOR2 domain-containing protein n=2 Tax=Gouania willdenowi TaxID=441366 RepID=A0A8C5DBZ4_GOUWI|nr:dynein light chain roadblock-type 2 isoform X1 [Gouania willdenowi]